MDQIEIGKLIASRRREKGLTQAQLAERLSITDRAVSKWERGLCLPDAALMLPLCSILDITAGELLCGHLLDEEDEYRRKTEALLVEMKERDEEKNAYLLKMEIVIGFISTLAFLAITVIVNLLSADARIIVPSMVVAVGIFLCGVFYALRIERDAGYYECPECHHKYVPEMISVVKAQHIGRKRKMKCPACGKRTWQRKVLS